MNRTQQRKMNIIVDPPHKRIVFGRMWADKMTIFIGSWLFIIALVCFILFWIAFNHHVPDYRWDNYPFIVLNLFLSCLTALLGPIILMSQKRAAERERAKLEQDYLITKKSELEIEHMQAELDEIKALLKKRAK